MMLNISSPCHQYASLTNSIWYSQLAAEVLELDVPSMDSEHRLAMTGDERCEAGWIQQVDWISHDGGGSSPELITWTE